MDRLFSSNTQLIEKLRSQHVVQSDKVANVMKQVDRADFTSHSPYSDSPQGNLTKWKSGHLKTIIQSGK